MPLRFVLDENARGPIWDAVLAHKAKGITPLDIVRVGDPADIPLGTLDPEVLSWAEREDRILISYDKNTMPGHLNDHLLRGNNSPGVLIVRETVPLAEVVDYLVILAYASDPWEWADRVDFIP
jgi:Domain of unknown function (DUF5615)